MTPPRTAASLDQVARPLRRWALARGVLAFLAGTVLVQATAVWALRVGIGAPAYLVLLAWAAVAGLLVLLAWRSGVESRRLGQRHLARRLETLGVARRGAVTALLDRAARGTSDALVAVADEERSLEVAREGGRVLAPAASRLRRSAALLALVLLGGAITLAAARPGSGPPALLWRPGWALEALLSPVRLRADPPVVDRGASLTLHYQATGQRSAVLWQRAPGEPWRAAPVALDSAGRGSTVINGVESDLYFHLSSGTRSSDTLRVTLRLPAFLGSLRVTARYPDYLDLEDGPIAPGPDPVLLPVGTELVTEGLASVPVRVAGWTGPGLRVPLQVRGREFHGQFRPRSSGTYQLDLATEDGRPLTGEPTRIVLTLVGDSIPEVILLAPATDTTASVDGRLTVVADARDDHGISAARLVLRRNRGGGIRTVTAPVEIGSPRLLLPFLVDLGDWDLGPGDTVRYVVEASDNAPAPQTGRSREYLLIVPTDADARAARRALAAATGSVMDSLIAATRRLERQTSDLSRERARAPEGQGSERRLGFEDARRAEAAALGQEELLQRAESLEQALEQLQESVERSGTLDSALARRLGELTEQLSRALSPELRDRLAELQRSVQALDPERTRQALQALAESQRALLEALERNRELFERAALESELSTLADDARDLAREQGELNREFAEADSNEIAVGESRLAERADSLAAGLDRAAERLDLDAAQQELERIADQAREAGNQMRSAAGSAQRGQREQGRQQGMNAQASMEDVARRTGEQREQQQDSWREEVMRALDRAMAETARLSRQQLGVAERFRQSGSPVSARADQAVVEDGAQKILDQIRTVSGQNAMVSPRIAASLTAARRYMAAAREAVSSGTPNSREASEQAGAAVDALNAATFAMARARQDVGGAASGSGLSEAMEQMNQMAQQQGQLSQQAEGLLPMAGQANIQAELQRLGAEQRALGDGLERLRAQGELPGARDLAQEAQELARRLDAGQLDRETVTRQERLFRRMLDAGRTLEGEEADERKERQSTPAGLDQLRLPPALLRRSPGDRLRIPSWEEMRLLTPEERRLATEYFRRLVGRTGS